MPHTNPDKPKCKQCGKRNSQTRFGDLCRPCYDANNAMRDTPVTVQKARNEKDWIREAESLKDVYTGIADGTIKATAAQARVLTTLWERAYGKPNKSQEDLAGAAGIVILPTVGAGEFNTLCPVCHSKYDKLALIKWKQFLTTIGKDITVGDIGADGSSNTGPGEEIGGRVSGIDKAVSAPGPELQVEAGLDGLGATDAEGDA